MNDKAFIDLTSIMTLATFLLTYTLLKLLSSYNNYLVKTIYFWLRIGLANAIYDYYRLKNRVACVGNFKSLMLINWICHIKSE